MTLSFKVCISFLRYFNSHAHVERDTGEETDVLVYAISTHTLTWSVTMSTLLALRQEMISTHTLTWSVTEFQKKM